MSLYAKVKRLVEEKGKYQGDIISAKRIYRIGGWGVLIDDEPETEDDRIVCLTYNGNIVYVSPSTLRGAKAVGVDLPWSSDMFVLEQFLREVLP